MEEVARCGMGCGLAWLVLVGLEKLAPLKSCGELLIEHCGHRSLVGGERHGGCWDLEWIVWDWCGAGSADGGAEVEAGVSTVGAGFGGGEFVCGADGFFGVAAGTGAG